MIDADETDAPSRYLIGIDLGTTNSALSYVDTAEKRWVVRDFAIPQLMAPATVEERATLPSFHYEAAAGEFAAGGLRLPWSADEPNIAVGALARDHGASAVGRLVVSAKSWLSHSGVDRTAGLLPWHAAGDVQKLSPVEVSTRYLAHMRAAWDHQFPEHPMSGQDVMLTAPASFDEVARELTVEAAHKAGLTHLVLVEEPQAAFYAWISAAGDQWDRKVKPGQKILICDVGGGTTDFTLIRVRPATGAKVLFHRVAVGEHLILGGDNFDLAIAHYVEKKLGRTLEPRAFGPLVRSSRVAKETLLGSDPPERFVINVSSGGSKLIGGAVQVELTREEIQELLLEGFLPRVKLDDVPQSRRSGFQEFGLPYARDAAITRYLAAFLTAHRHAGQRADETPPTDHDAARPDLVLFNGGLFESPILRERLLEVMQSWFGNDAAISTPVLRYAEGPDSLTHDPALRSTSEPASTNAEKDVSHSKGAGAKPWQPIVLKNDRLDLAVARGAAYYGMVRRGRGVRISGGLAHSYYIGVESADAAAKATCLAPAGVEEGQTVNVAERTFNLLIRQPVEFPLYSSSTRTTDAPGDLLVVDDEQMTALPPIRTVLQSGRKANAEAVQVRLHAKLTEIGTLDIRFAEIKGDRTWRLQFDVRAASRPDIASHKGTGEAEGVLDEGILTAARERITAAFRRGGERCESLVKKLEEVTALGRHDWPSTLLRGMWETLMEVADGRRISETHELARWLNLTGFCLRPGYGLAADDWRVAQTWKLFPAGVSFAKNELVRAEWQVLWRRLAGGLSGGQQRTLADPLVADWRDYFRKAGSNVRGRSPTFQFGPHESAEAWRLLGSLELLPIATKLEIGEMLLTRLAREQSPNLKDAQLFALGRLEARVPVYGPLNALIAAEDAERWMRCLLEIAPADDKAAFAVVQLCRRTGDRYRDVSKEAQAKALAWLAPHNAPDHWRQLVREGGQLQSDEQRIVFGETLPRGLRIE